MTATMLAWIRPWYPAGDEGHIYPDCPALPQPAGEGPGWLDAHGKHVCKKCADRHLGRWDAQCHTCDATMSGEEDWPRGEDAARRWLRDHVCTPFVEILPPPAPPRPQPAPGQLTLPIDLQEAA